jgi:hypothetical protein
MSSEPPNEESNLNFGPWPRTSHHKPVAAIVGGIFSKIFASVSVGHLAF